jgi:response regulator NasT
MHEDNRSKNTGTARRRILLVEDDRLVLATVAQGLRDAQYEVLTAESGDEALELLADGTRPDLAVLDMCMPGQDGLQLAQSLQALERIPFLMFSAYSEPDLVAQAAQAGAWGYLVKPLDVAQLVPAIDTALARADQDVALRDQQRRMQQALDADRDIGVAVGLTMALYRVGRNKAFELLRSNARGQRRRLHAVAQELVQAHQISE